MNNLSVFILISILFFTIFSYSQNNSSLYINNPDKYVAEQLFNKRIVMLGDFRHHVPASLHTLFQVLEEWKKTVVNSDNECHLTLVLEQTSINGNAIDKYIKGEEKDLLNVFLLEAYLEDFEFLDDLKSFYKELSGLKEFSTGKISFMVKGFEVNMNDQDFARMTLIERDMWFIEKRDLNISEKLINYINEKPNEKILMFYGNGHLRNGFVMKSQHTYTIRDSISGYYLSHYLKEKFGDDEVITFCQVQYRDNIFTEPFSDYTGADEIYLKTENAKWSELIPGEFDGIVVRKSTPQLNPHPISMLYSSSLTGKIINALTRLQTENNLYFNQLFNYSFFTALFGIKFPSINDMAEWYNRNKQYLYPDTLSSPKIGERIFYLLYKDANRRSVKYELEMLGIYMPDHRPDSVTWRKDSWPQALKHMKFFAHLVNFWAGTETEKSEGKKYLMEFSGEDFPEAVQYFKWYRKKYYHYDF